MSVNDEMQMALGGLGVDPAELEKEISNAMLDDEILFEQLKQVDRITVMIHKFWNELPDTMPKDLKEALAVMWFSVTFGSAIPEE